MTYLRTFESVKTHPLPDWYNDAKLGIFIHWGIYSVPAFAPHGEHFAERMLEGELGFGESPYAEWYQNSLRLTGSPTHEYHLKTYGRDFRYEAFAPLFNQQIQQWDPNSWADLFSRAGARYVVLVSKHHDDPRMLYLGYIGITIPFAFGIAALLAKRLDSGWIHAMRKWTILAWLFLSVGIILGMWWAYVELGWGGYWAWDPVENASLLPWLTMTAFLHSVMIQEKRGMLKRWNMSLVIGTFLLSILGTFITRSGVFASVHSFAQSSVGYFFLVFLVTTGAAAFALLYLRWPQLEPETHLESMASREAAFLFNNLVLVGIAFSVLWGTMFPILSERRLFPTVREKGEDCEIVAAGVSCRQQIAHGTGRRARHLVEVLAEAIS